MPASVFSSDLDDWPLVDSPCVVGLKYSPLVDELGKLGYRAIYSGNNGKGQRKWGTILESMYPVMTTCTEKRISSVTLSLISTHNWAPGSWLEISHRGAVVSCIS